MMIMLSTMYTRKYGNNLNSEFNPSNLFPKKDASKKNSKPEDSNMQIQRDIESINVSDISAVRMMIEGDKTVQIRSENLIKIAKLITSSYKKTDFTAWELQDAYDMISQNYKSSLSPSQYKRIQEVVKVFVDKWGKIEFIKK